MTFNNITNGTDCDCLKDGFQDNATVYVRKINKPTLREVDFQSYWERGDNQYTDCETVCGKKGISISKVEKEEHKTALISNYSEVFKVTPNYRPNLFFFKFKDNAGVVKDTPTEVILYHHDFYKCDTFTLADNIEQVEIVELQSHV